MKHLVITVRWLDDRYHGLLSPDGPPEWPPSPYRLFQALVAGLARGGELESDLGQSIALLQRLDPPMILAPRSRPGQITTRFVPNNDADKKPDRQSRLTDKTSLPTLILDLPMVHYLWEIKRRELAQANLVSKAARYLTCLGWGIDMAYAHGKVIANGKITELPGIRWYPRKDVRRDYGLLRVPTVDRETGVDSLSDLKRAHNSATNRIEHGKPLNAVEKPKVFDRVFYESTERLLGRPWEFFELRRDDGTRFSYPLNRQVHIAGMIRHLAIEKMEQSTPDGVDAAWVERYVAGHVGANEVEHRQFSYVPLPSVGYIHTDPSVRRVMVAAPLGDDRFLRHLAIRLDGEELKPTVETNLQSPPTLVRFRRDKVTPFYLGPANTWASITPVILPGHNEHKPEKTRKLIEKALAQSGISQPCEFEWSAYSHFPKSPSAHKYDRSKRAINFIRPDHLLTETAVHMKLRFNDGVEVPGPIVVGAGRHCGFGLFARIDGW